LKELVEVVVVPTGVTEELQQVVLVQVELATPRVMLEL
jgi:hypothetical protein